MGILKIKKRIAYKFARNREGAAAVEFAIVAPVFLAVMFSIMEVGWVFFADSVSERATEDAVRLIRTGQIQQISNENDPNAQRQAVFDEVCNLAKIFGNCNETLTVEVTTFQTFEALADDNTEVLCRDGVDEDAGVVTEFDPGTDDSIVRVRICILYQTLNPVVGLTLAAGEGSPNTLITQHLFRNEPFSRNVDDI